MRDRHRRPKHTSEPRGLAHSPLEGARLGKTPRQSAVISRKAASRVTRALRTQPKGILLVRETVLAGDLLSEGRDQAFAIDGEAELSLDAVQDLGDR